MRSCNFVTLEIELSSEELESFNSETDWQDALITSGSGEGAPFEGIRYSGTTVRLVLDL